MFGIDINAKQVTQDQLAQILVDLDGKGMVPVSFTTVTKFGTRKIAEFEKFELDGYSGKGGQTHFMKVSQSNGNIGINYTAKVNREREKEGLDGDFKAKPSPYKFVTESVREKEGRHYLFYYPRNAAADFETVIVGKKAGEAEFGSVDVDDIQHVIPVPKEKPTSGRQELSEGNEVRPQTVSFGSIAAVKVNGQSYVVSDLDDYRMDAFEIAFEQK